MTVLKTVRSIGDMFKNHRTLKINRLKKFEKGFNVFCHKKIQFTARFLWALESVGREGVGLQMERGHLPHCQVTPPHIYFPKLVRYLVFRV